MVTALFYFVFHIAALISAHIVQDFAEHPFERIVLYLTTFGAIGVLNCLIAVVTDIECSTVEMARVLCRIFVVVPQLIHIILCTQHAGHNHFMERHLFHLQTIKESPSNIVQQYGKPSNWFSACDFIIERIGD